MTVGFLQSNRSGKVAQGLPKKLTKKYIPLFWVTCHAVSENRPIMCEFFEHVITNWRKETVKKVPLNMQKPVGFQLF